MATEYEENLANLVRDIRKDLNIPKLPFVIGEQTAGGDSGRNQNAWAALRKAQAAVAEREEFRGSVALAPTHQFLRKPAESPMPSHAHHSYCNAETYFLVGDALGKAMLELLPEKKAGK